MIGKPRKFGKKLFKLGARTVAKENAVHYAEARRVEGFHARIVKRKANYYVYTRRK